MKRKDNISQSEKLEKGLEELGVLASKNEIERLIEHIKSRYLFGIDSLSVSTSWAKHLRCPSHTPNKTLFF